MTLLHNYDNLILYNIINMIIVLREFEGDDRMVHKCTWERHREHFGEKHETFYIPYKEIVERQRLVRIIIFFTTNLYFNKFQILLLNSCDYGVYLQTIPAKFLGDHPMHTYTKCYMRHQKIDYRMSVKMVPHNEDPARTNHVIITGEWKMFADECFIKYNQMLRFKYMFNVEVLDGADAGVFLCFSGVLDSWITKCFVFCLMVWYVVLWKCGMVQTRI